MVKLETEQKSFIRIFHWLYMCMEKEGCEPGANVTKRERTQNRMKFSEIVIYGAVL